MFNDLISGIQSLRKALASADTNSRYAPMTSAGVIMLHEIEVAITVYRYNPDRNTLNRHIIMAALDFVQRWETWLETVRFESKDTRMFHDFLLRFSKGSIKAYRGWNIDLQNKI